MPSMRYTPNNPGGQLVDDPLDGIEAGNRGAAIQAAGMNAGLLQNNAMTQLMLARLKSDDYHYGQDRTDKLGMFNQGLQAQSQALDKEYGYLGARDASADSRWNKEFTFQTDPTANPMLKSQIGVNDAQSQYMQYLLTQKKADAERAATAGNAPPDLTGASPTDRATYTADIASGLNPAQATAQQKAREFERAKGEVGTVESALGGDLDTFSNRDNAWVGWDPTDSDRSSIATRLAKLEETLRVKLGMSQDQAHEEANNLLRQHTKHSLNSGSVDALRQLRGVPY